MKRITQFSVLLALALTLTGALSLTSCKKSKDPYLGSAVKAASANFTAGTLYALRTTDASVPTPAQFAMFGLNVTPEVWYFNCNFNEEVTWTLTLTGKSSGAVKTINGTSNSLPLGNILTQWNGSSSGNRFFQQGDSVYCKLTFLGTTQERTTKMLIRNTAAGPLKYENRPYVALLDNFDGKFAGSSMVTAYTDLADGTNNSIYLERANNTVTPIDGTFMLRFKGLDVNNNTYLGGTGPELLTSHAGAIEKLVPECATDASQLYVNLYIYGTGLVNSNLQVRSYEIDTLDICKEDGYSATNPYPIAYSIAAQGQNDQWATDIYINWTGWKLVSIPYSAFKPAANPASGGNGNRVREPRKVTSIGLLLQSMPNPGASVDCYVDYVTFTWGQPFIQ